MPYFRLLSPEDQEELLAHARIFIAEKIFEGAGGLVLNEEIQVTVAGHACLLLLHRDTDYYPRLTTIIVYPSGYLVGGERPVGGGIWTEDEDYLLGHTQPKLGALVLAWDSVRHAAASPFGGNNLVLHEFAHQLDFEDGTTDGTPLLDTHHEQRSWVEIMRAELNALRRAADRGEPTILNTYGTQNPAEFFAVATEAFFERPIELRQYHSKLYAVLQQFFKQNPAELLEEFRASQGSDTASLFSREDIV
jgi:MtfA peptidase